MPLLNLRLLRNLNVQVPTTSLPHKFQNICKKPPAQNPVPSTQNCTARCPECDASESCFWTLQTGPDTEVRTNTILLTASPSFGSLAIALAVAFFSQLFASVPMVCHGDGLIIRVLNSWSDGLRLGVWIKAESAILPEGLTLLCPSRAFWVPAPVSSPGFRRRSVYCPI